MTRDDVSRVLSDVRTEGRQIDLDVVGGVDRALQGVAECRRVAILDAIEHNLVPLDELVHVHAQMRCAWMPDRAPLSVERTDLSTTDGWDGRIAGRGAVRPRPPASAALREPD